MTTATSPPPITTTGRKRPGAYILHGLEGVGKTSFGAHTTKPIFLQTKGETGLETLINAGRLPPISHFEGDCQTWELLLQDVSWLLEDKHEYKTLVIDTLNGAERMCYDYIVKKHFDGKAGDDGFLSYHKGYKVAMTDWRRLLNGLDKLRTEKQMAVLCLCHTTRRTFQNPEGADYDRYEPAFESRDAWGLTHKWADAVLFMNFHTEVVTQGRKQTKGKAHGGQSRVIYTERHASYDAKNRFGLADEIEADGSGQVAWNNFIAALKKARNKKEN